MPMSTVAVPAWRSSLEIRAPRSAPGRAETARGPAQMAAGQCGGDIRAGRKATASLFPDAG